MTILTRQTISVILILILHSMPLYYDPIDETIKAHKGSRDTSSSLRCTMTGQLKGKQPATVNSGGVITGSKPSCMQESRHLGLQEDIFYGCRYILRSPENEACYHLKSVNNLAIISLEKHEDFSPYY